MNDGLREREAPERVEERLVSAFRRHHRARRIGRLIAATGVAAALAVVAWMSLRPREVPRVQVKRAESPPQARPQAKDQWSPYPATRPAMRLRPGSSLPHIEKPVTVAARRVHRRKPRPMEVTTAFLPLDAAPMELNGGEVVRMEVPRSTLTLFGLPMDARRVSVPVQADVLFGEDGMAHAVRFVSTTSYEIPTKR